MPTISVVIPAYNAERTILETVASVLQQTFSDFELIVIDDGSRDRTVELLQSIKDERLKVFSYENGGLPVARNRGISRSTGEFITFVDADDLWTPDKLELQLAALQQHPEAGVAYSWTSCIDEQGELLFQYAPTFYEGNVYAQLLIGDFIYSGSNTMIRRQAIESAGEFDPTFKSCEDWDYWLRLAVRWPFVVVRKHQILYRRSSGAMSSKIDVMKEAALIAIDKAYKAAPPELQSLKNQTLTSFYKYCAELYLRYSTNLDGISKAGHNLWLASRANPKVVVDRNFLSLFKWLIKRWILIGLSPNH